MATGMMDDTKSEVRQPTNEERVESLASEVLTLLISDLVSFRGIDEETKSRMMYKYQDWFEKDLPRKADPDFNRRYAPEVFIKHLLNTTHRQVNSIPYDIALFMGNSPSLMVFDDARNLVVKRLEATFEQITLYMLQLKINLVSNQLSFTDRVQLETELEKYKSCMTDLKELMATIIKRVDDSITSVR